jgi:predicted RNase H-like HicB family nuclease
MTEYPAMIYKTNRNRTFMANCIVKNLVGFGKTEEEALNNLKKSLCHHAETCDISVKPVYGISLAQ